MNTVSHRQHGHLRAKTHMHTHAHTHTHTHTHTQTGTHTHSGTGRATVDMVDFRTPPIHVCFDTHPQTHTHTRSCVCLNTSTCINTTMCFGGLLMSVCVCGRLCISRSAMKSVHFVPFFLLICKIPTPSLTPPNGKKAAAENAHAMIRVDGS